MNFRYAVYGIILSLLFGMCVAPFAAAQSSGSGALSIFGSIVNFFQHIFSSTISSIPTGKLTGMPTVSTTTVVQTTLVTNTTVVTGKIKAPPVNSITTSCITGPPYLCSDPSLSSSGALTLNLEQVSGSTYYDAGLACSQNTQVPSSFNQVASTLQSGQQISASAQCSGVQPNTEYYGYLWVSYQTSIGGPTSYALAGTLILFPSGSGGTTGNFPNPYSYTYTGMFSGNSIKLGWVPNNSIELLSDSVYIGNITDFQTQNPYYSCLDGETLNVWQASSEYPGYYVVHNGDQGAQCVFGTWIFTAPPSSGTTTTFPNPANYIFTGQFNGQSQTLTWTLNQNVDQYPDSTYVGEITDFYTTDPYYSCLNGQTLYVYSAEAEYPGELVAHGGITTDTCTKYITMILPQQSNGGGGTGTFPNPANYTFTGQFNGQSQTLTWTLNQNVDQYPDSSYVGALDNFYTTDPYYSCLNGITLYVYSAPSEYPNELVAHGGMTSASCNNARYITLILPQDVGSGLVNPSILANGQTSLQFTGMQDNYFTISVTGGTPNGQVQIYNSRNSSISGIMGLGGNPIQLNSAGAGSGQAQFQSGGNVTWWFTVQDVDSGKYSNLIPVTITQHSSGSSGTFNPQMSASQYQGLNGPMYAITVTNFLNANPPYHIAFQLEYPGTSSFTTVLDSNYTYTSSDSYDMDNLPDGQYYTRALVTPQYGQATYTNTASFSVSDNYNGGTGCTPVIYGGQPDLTGAPGSYVTFTGTNFGTAQGEVQFSTTNGWVAAQITSWTPTAVTVIVPSVAQGDASVDITGSCGVSSWPMDTAAIAFTVLGGGTPPPPASAYLAITSPHSYLPGTNFITNISVANGDGVYPYWYNIEFTTAGGNRLFNVTEENYGSSTWYGWNYTGVGMSPGGTYYASVKVTDGEGRLMATSPSAALQVPSGGTTTTILPTNLCPTPTISYISPSSGQPYTKLTIYGSYFWNSSSPGLAAVRFYDSQTGSWVSAPAVFYTGSYSLTATVPNLPPGVTTVDVTPACGTWPYNTGASSFTVTQSPSVMNANLSISVSKPGQNIQVAMAANVTGGTGPYDYTFYLRQASSPGFGASIGTTGYQPSTSWGLGITNVSGITPQLYPGQSYYAEVLASDSAGQAVYSQQVPFTIPNYGGGSTSTISTTSTSTTTVSVATTFPSSTTSIPQTLQSCNTTVSVDTQQPGSTSSLDCSWTGGNLYMIYGLGQMSSATFTVTGSSNGQNYFQETLTPLQVQNGGSSCVPNTNPAYLPAGNYQMQIVTGSYYGFNPCGPTTFVQLVAP